jgi:hypothetical protein
MTENRAGREAETQKSTDQRTEQPTKQSGDELAHNQPPNPEPAEGPRDPDYTGDTYPQTKTGDQEQRAE